mmetsp:Transcript_65945/g.212715  ORF Transcript_65945/g.212715 Transcript_65945/m.212715 type:complete len:214 (+) Transcript_65945:619-1260(+)
MPTRIASAPASSKGFAWRGVTTLPQTTSRLGKACFTCFRKSICCTESPCEASSTKASAPASTSFLTLSCSSGLGVQAAATRSWLLGSVEARGYARLFFRSPRLTTATSSPASLRMGSFPRLLARSFCFASEREMGSRPTCILALGVITSASFACLSSTKSRSRLVTMPRSLLPISPPSVTSTVETSRSCLKRSASSTRSLGERTCGSMMKPFS